MKNKILGINLSEKDINISEKLLEERFEYLELRSKEAEKFVYQDEVNLYYTIKISQLLNRIEELERKVSKSDIHFTRFK